MNRHSFRELALRREIKGFFVVSNPGPSWKHDGKDILWLGNYDIDFFNFHHRKFETSKFWICLNETEILQSSFKGIESDTESQQSTSQLNESKVLYH